MTTTTARPRAARRHPRRTIEPVTAQREHERQHLGRARCSERAGGDREAPAAIGLVVDEQHAARRHVEPVGAEPLPDPGEPERAVAAGLPGRAAGGGRERAEVGEPADLRDPAGERVDEQRTGARRHRDDGHRPLPPTPVGEHPHARREHLRRHGSVGRARGEQFAQRAAPSEVGEAGERAALIGLLTRWDAALHRDAEPIGPGRPGATRLDRHAHTVERARGRVRRARIEVARIPGAGAVVAAAARLRRLVVEGALEELHAASVGQLVVDHVLLLGLALGGDAPIALGVVRPRLARGDPAALHAAHRTVDVEHLEQQSSGVRRMSTRASSAGVDRGMSDSSSMTRRARSSSGIDAVAK